MTAIKKEELARLEEEYGVEAGDLSYQHRCSRITALMKGEEWEVPLSTMQKRANFEEQRTKEGRINKYEAAKMHPLWGKKLLIAPLMTLDAKRNLAFDEPVGHEINVREASAGEMIYGAAEDIDRMVGDYVIIDQNVNKTIYAKTTFPKVGTELTYTLGTDLVPVVRGNDGQRGYIWSFPTSVFQVEDTMIQMMGLKTIIENVYPELLPKFSGRPTMMYIDGVTLAASIPFTTSILKEQRRKDLVDERAGLV